MCGLPYIGKFNKEEFLEKHMCISDVLKKFGYTTSTTFGTQIHDWGYGYIFIKHNYDYLNPGNPRVRWTQDRETYPVLVSQLTKQSKLDKPFFAFMSTMDSHHPGLLCPDCPKDIDPEYQAFRCTSTRFEEFFNWCKKQKWFNDTLIVIQGDHFERIDKLFSNPIYKDYKRGVYNVFINSEIKDRINTENRTFNSIDIYPSILAAAGFKIKNDRLGLGTNLFSNRKTVMEEFGIEKFTNESSATLEWYAKTYLENSYCVQDEPCISVYALPK